MATMPLHLENVGKPKKTVASCRCTRPGSGMTLVLSSPADERKLSAIYVFVEDELEEKFSYDSETISMLHERRNNHISGASKSYTAEESLETIRGKKR